MPAASYSRELKKKEAARRIIIARSKRIEGGRKRRRRAYKNSPLLMKARLFQFIQIYANQYCGYGPREPL